MKFFKYIECDKDLFYKPPTEFNILSDKRTLSYCLGATLYMSSLRGSLLQDLLKTDSTSVVICLEDAISSTKVAAAELNVIQLFEQLDTISKLNVEFLQKLPLIFLRIRSFTQFKRLLSNTNFIGLCGFVFPKFTSESGASYFSELQAYNNNFHRKFYGMPIIETQNVIDKQTRLNELIAIKNALEPYKQLVLNIRIGGTDFSGIYGLRRDKFHTIYDLAVIKDCISDIINIFKLEDYVISAPVNEYYHFEAPLEDYGFYKEILLDKMNGLIGKTAIHPTQIELVNSLMVVSKEEYLDAKAILSSSEDGVIRSLYRNKMNEIRPHTKWARNIMELSRITGVYNHGKDYRNLLSLSKNCTSRESFENIVDY